MSTHVGIDPGPTLNKVCVINEDIIGAFAAPDWRDVDLSVVAHREWLRALRSHALTVTIEHVVLGRFKVGTETGDTIHNEGRLWEFFSSINESKNYDLTLRRATPRQVATHVSGRDGDAAIRKAMMQMFRMKREAGRTSHHWRSLALAVYGRDHLGVR